MLSGKKMMADGRVGIHELYAAKDMINAKPNSGPLRFCSRGEWDGKGVQVKLYHILNLIIYQDDRYRVL